MANAARDQLLTDFKELQFAVFYTPLLTTGDYSDSIITCGPDVYKVHKNIVCKRSKFLAAASSFKCNKEAEDGRVDLPEDEPEIVRLLVQYLYEAEYDPHGLDEPPKEHTCHSFGDHCNTPNVCKHHQCGVAFECSYSCQRFICIECHPLDDQLPADSMLTHAKMYEIGDKYDVVGLKELAKNKFAQICRVHWNSPHFPTAAKHAFSTTPDEDKGLRDIVRKTISNHMHLIADKPEIKEIMKEYNGLAYDLFMETAAMHGWLKES
ncbi:hypothetical protein K491DRAFT_716060 [Lophiostoma macrostomum CBS 122681]|uniref:BTB domain-containing protein n=1 Tax=Lophiostoma macrostomum CBS 122681 TaxID=1314788 RepID=A0A6A6T9S1_9PLEO|nr:hypothetical protein K491DRAFT_716060 [Lophiostoma macrostomum CBS 122681]